MEATNTRLIAVGVSEEVNKQRLQSILQDPERDYFGVDQFEDLSGMLDDIIEAVCFLSLSYILVKV